MSIICNLRQVTDEEIQELLENPADIFFFLYGEEPALPPSGFFSRLFDRKQEKKTETRQWHPPKPGEEIDLDKAWHGIHYLLTGSVTEGEEPFCFLLKGGKEIGDEDVGYGPARALTGKQTRHFWEAISEIKAEGLRTRFQPADMVKEDIYPEIWDRDPEDDDTFGYLLEYFQMLKKFLKEAVEKKMGLVIYMN